MRLGNADAKARWHGTAQRARRRLAFPLGVRHLEIPVPTTASLARLRRQRSGPAAKRAVTPSLIDYSPSAEQTYRFCQKKAYFGWLTRKKQGWRKPTEHPWRRAYELKQLKHQAAWAGDLYHQVVAHALRAAQIGRPVDQATLRRTAHELTAIQFAFSAAGEYCGATKSKVADHKGLPTFLALFDHAYGLPTDGLLAETQTRLDSWLVTTFAWDGWAILLEQIRRGRAAHIEPEGLLYTLAGARVRARMDVDTEPGDGTFRIYDWKCYGNPERSAASGRGVQRQLLAYALWPVLRPVSPLPLSRVIATVFNPVSGEAETVRFADEDHAAFELEVGRWVSLQAQLFTEIAEVNFDDLEGPYNPARSCPHCPFKAVCGEEIAWHDLT